MKINLIYPFIFFIIVSSCEPTLISEFKDRPVVECYLKAGESPVVTISKLTPFKDDVVFSTENINNLILTINDDTADEEFQLNSLGEGKYSNSNIIIKEGHQYSLSFVYDQIPVTATTIVPDAPKNMTLSTSSISIRGYYSGEISIKDANPVTFLEVTWENPDSSYYVVALVNSEETPKQIWNTDSTPSTGFQTEPTSGNSTLIAPHSFNYYGNHSVTLYKIRSEYAVMCSALNNTTEYLSEVIANIKNGYGIFTGISGVSKPLYVFKAN